MSALIEEVVVFDVTCPDPGCNKAIAEGITVRSEAEFIAQSHDDTWHVPAFDDELVGA